MVIRHDTFKDEVVFAKSGSDQYQIFGDADYVGLREVLERRGFKSIGRELIRDVVGKIANENQFDTATEWLGQQAWDGVPRVESFLADHFGVIDSPYMRAVGRYIWTALAGRIVQPGVKADIAPIFIGGQGVRKTTAVENMSPDKAFFAEFNLADRDADMSRKMRGRLVGEIGELRGLHTKDLESIKSFLSQTHEKWTPKFKEFETTFPRRLIFFGTTNQREFLSDPTGSRRFAPIMVGERPDIVEHDLAHSTEALKHLKWKIDTDAIADARDQLWAEGAVLFKNGGVDYSEIEILAERTHAEHTLSDPWAEIVNEWLDAVDGITGEIPRTRKFLRTVDVLQECLAFDVKGINRLQEMRIASVLRQIGYSRRKQRIGQVTAWVFVPT
jgi:predicted P-loop ATPase